MKRMILMLALAAAAIGALGFEKVRQIQQGIAQAAAFSAASGSGHYNCCEAGKVVCNVERHWYIGCGSGCAC